MEEKERARILICIENITNRITGCDNCLVKLYQMLSNFDDARSELKVDCQECEDRAEYEYISAFDDYRGK